MFEEDFMDFGGFPGDVTHGSSYWDRRLTDLGFGGFPTDGFPVYNSPNPSMTPLANPLVNDQFYRNLWKLNSKAETVGSDLDLCQNLCKMSISDDTGSIFTGSLVDSGFSGCRTFNGGSMYDQNLSYDAGVSRHYDPFFDGSSAVKGSQHSSHLGVSMGGYIGDNDGDRLGLLGLQDYYSPKDFTEIMARQNRDYLLEHTNRSFQQRRPITGLGPYPRDASLLQKQSRLDFQGNNLFESSLMYDGNKALRPFAGVGAYGLEDSLIIQGSNMKFSAKCRKNGLYDESSSSSNGSEHDFSLNLASMVGSYGSVYLMAKDQIGCRFLQKLIEGGTFLDAMIVFREVINHVIDLATDPFGNYFVQKLLEVCNEEQRMQILIMLTSKPGRLVKISLNTYGTRVVQKLIETLRSKEQISLVQSALKPGFLSLVRDLNGNHVIQRCLQSLNHNDNKFIFEAATRLCTEIATHRHGCCVLQRCVSYSVGAQRDKLVAAISRNSLLLAQDPFGNYVVQYIIEQKVKGLNLLFQLRGKYVELATQKFSSHVVEKCLRYYPESRSQIVRELTSVPNFEHLLQDPFANYVIQSALSVTKGVVRETLVVKVRPYGNLKTSPYCKRIFSKSLLKNVT